MYLAFVQGIVQARTIFAGIPITYPNHACMQFRTAGHVINNHENQFHCRKFYPSTRTPRAKFYPSTKNPVLFTFFTAARSSDKDDEVVEEPEVEIYWPERDMWYDTKQLQKLKKEEAKQRLIAWTIIGAGALLLGPRLIAAGLESFAVLFLLSLFLPPFSAFFFGPFVAFTYYSWFLYVAVTLLGLVLLSNLLGGNFAILSVLISAVWGVVILYFNLLFGIIAVVSIIAVVGLIAAALGFLL
mmetsp:Transcript_30970/g.50104  ORF Transcript_30970/g.50104 Transcript_30970/m.50104 type:complete len:242 (-) Transcript_30970:152-877(-)